MNNKGQVSIFIIIGVVLMLLTVVFLSLNGSKSLQNNYEVTEKVDAQFVAVQKYVTTCLEQVALNGLEKLGSQGGYVDPTKAGLLVNYPASKQPAQAFQFVQGSNLVVPYWYYLSSRMDCTGDCRFDSKAPELEGSNPKSIQSQLQTYVDSHIDECLDDFKTVGDGGFIVSVLESQETTVLIRDNDVRFYLSYPLEVTHGVKKQKMTEYGVDLAVPLRPLYNYAALITAAQQKYTFLERHMISVISFNSGPSSKLLPPSTATTYDYVSTVFWLKSRVKQQLQELLSTYVPGLRVVNARNYEPAVYEPSDVSSYGQLAIQRVYDNMVLPLNSTGDDPLNIDNRFDVSFESLNWPIYFDVNSEGEIIKPHSLAVSDFLFGMQQYDTYYDITYPVRVSLVDPTALKGNGFTFAFGLQGNIRGSSPLDENYTLLSGDVNAGTFVCNQDQYNSGDSQITVVDNKTGAPIGDVALTFTCGTETCTVGTTGGDGKWSGKMPICGGALLTFVKDDSYAQRALSVSTNLDESLDIDVVSLEPYRVFNASVMKKLIKKNMATNDWAFSSPDVALSPKEFAIVSYKQIGEAYGTDPVQGAFMYYGGVGSTDETTVKLVPGIYEVTIQSILDEPLVIPKQERSKRILFKKLKFTIPEVKMDQFPGGSLTLNESTGYWYVTEYDLDSGADAVTFYALSPDIPGIPLAKRVVEDLQIINDAASFVGPNYNSLVPQFVAADSLYVPTSVGDPIITMLPITDFEKVDPDSYVEYSVNVVGSQEIKTYRVLQPTPGDEVRFSGSVGVRIPANAFGSTLISFEFTFTDGNKVTKSVTLPVRSSSELVDISATLRGIAPASAYEFSNKTRSSAILYVLASFADGTSHDITESIQSETTNESVVDIDDDAKLSFYSAGEANITVIYDSKSVEIPITITTE